MNFKLALSSVALGLVVLAGCSADATDPGTSTDSDLVAPMPPVNVKGAWRSKPGTSTGSRSFQGIVFNADGTFFADANTGIMCVMAPCPTSARLEGTYSVFGRAVVLTPKAGANDDFGLYGRYSVSRRSDTGDALDTLRLERFGTEALGSELTLQSSYCGEPIDCAGQGIIHPMCAGYWTCSEQSTCGYACGVVVENEIWPSDRTQLVAQTAGGGFTPPPAPGSTCGLGAAKYTLDIASRKLSWEVCKFTDWSTPMHPVSGTRTLSAADVKKVDRAMAQVKLAERDICGADKPMLNIAVTSTSKGTVQYTDSFYACMGGERTYVDNIDEVFSAFRDVAGE